MELKPDQEKLLELAFYKMPFGKYKGHYLVDIPLYYLVWFSQKGFPEGKLGQHMRTMLDIKDNGLEELIKTIQSEFPQE